MLRWIDILRFANQGSPEPDHSVSKTDDEWRAHLSQEQFQVTRLRGTERPFSSEMCHLFGQGLYACVCCDSVLFDANEKFESGTGWPSFTQPFKQNAIAYHDDNSHGMRRIEAICNVCGAHLGHVFPDGPEPSGLRYCMNAIALKKVNDGLEKATFGGGCFWCTEVLFQSVPGVHSVVSGYSGGEVVNPSYREVCSGKTGHAEVVQIIFDPQQISYADLLRLHLATHDPTTLNRQGADTGTQYRSVIFPHHAAQKEIAEQVLLELQSEFNTPIVTSIEPMQGFYPAEDHHQNYYRENSDERYCQVVIAPKLTKLRALLVKG